MIGTITRGKSFDGVLRYVLDKDSATLLLSNVPATRRSPSAAATAMETVALRNDRVRQPVYHIAVSPSQTEQLDDEQWRELGDRLLEELNLQGHQFVMGLHHDTTYPDSSQPRTHAHIVVNLVDFYGQRADTSWDYYRIQKAMRTLEREFELDSPFLDDGSPSPPARSDTKGQYERYQREQAEYEDPLHPRTHPPELSCRKQLQQHLDRALTEADGWDSFRDRLEGQGITIHHSDHGWALALEKTYFAGYQLGKKYTYPAIVQQLELEPISVAHPDEPTKDNSTTATVEPSAPTIGGGIGSALAATSGLEPDVLDAEVIDSEEVQSPEEIATATVVETVQNTNRVLGDANHWAHQFADPQTLDGNFVVEQTGKTLKVGAELATEHIEGVLASNGKPQEADIAPPPEQESLTALPEAVDEAEVVVDPQLEGHAGELPPHQWNDQELADKLSDFVTVRAEAHSIPADQPIPTSIGTLTVSDDSIHLVGKPSEPVTVETPGGLVSTGEAPLFEATKGDNGWDVSTNILSDDAKARIDQLPTTEGAYQAHQNGSVVVQHILAEAKAADVPIHEVDAFEITDQGGAFHYDFTLTHEADGTQIMGQNTDGSTVLDATLRNDGSLTVAQSAIAPRAIDQLQQLDSQRQHTQIPHQQAPEQLERDAGKARER